MSEERGVYTGILRCLVTKSYPALSDPMDCSPPGSSFHGISQARILEWVTISFSNNGIFSSVQFSRSVVSDSLRPHEPQHARPPCPSSSPGVHHSSNASILQCSAFFTVQLSHPYMTTRKTIALTRRTLVGKVMSLLLNMLSRLVITSSKE